MTRTQLRSASLGLLAVFLTSSFGPFAFAQTAPPATTPAAQKPNERVERGNLVLENVPVTPDSVRERLIQYQNVRSASFQGFTPEGGILIATRFAEVPQIHEVKMPLGARSQLTYAAEPIGGASIRPDGSGTFVYGKDKGGDEFFQAYLFDRKNGRATQLTEPGTRNEGLTWSRDGKVAAWTITRSGQTKREIMVMTGTDTASRKVVFTGEGSWGVDDFSPDGTKLILGNYISVTESKMFVLDLASGKTTEIKPGKAIALGGGTFSADGKFIFAVSDEDSQFQRVVKIEIATGATTVLTPNTNWDVEEVELSKDGRILAYVVNVDGKSELNLIDTATEKAISGPKLPPGLLGGLSFNDAGNKLGFTFSSAKSPGDVWVFDLKTANLTRWTESEIGGLNPETFVEAELIRYPTFDTVNGKPRTIPAFVYRAPGKGPSPVIIDIHGGPEGQSRPGFGPTRQYWIDELGATVIVPNVRGSTGYGKDFVSLDNGFKREDSVKDIGALLDWIATQPGLDKNRVVVYGGSYGGYMVLASLTHFNDRLAGGVNIVGISSFLTFLQNTQGYRVDLRRVEYGDERDPAMRAHLEKISPLTNASKITKPLFVIQGLNDPRVPYTEAEQITTKVRANGANVWFMMAKDEGHGFRKKANRDAQREAETLWFRQVFGQKPAQ